MGTFEDDLLLRYEDGGTWALLQGFTYCHRDHICYHVPAGFETDFASIPRLFWNLLPPTGTYGKAAVIHDFLYRTPTVPVTRAEADQVFRDAMKDLGVSSFTRTLMWSAVRSFGSRAFKARSHGQ